MKTASRPKYYLVIADAKDHHDRGPWRSYDLESEGNNLEELLANAVYWQTDQDGGSLGDIPADDQNAEELITEWFSKRELIERAAPTLYEAARDAVAIPLICLDHVQDPKIRLSIVAAYNNLAAAINKADGK